MVKIWFLGVMMGAYLLFSGGVRAVETEKEETFEAVVQKIVTTTEGEIIEMRLKTGEVVKSVLDEMTLNSQVRYKINDRVLVTKTIDLEGKDLFIINDFVRKPALELLMIGFVIFTLMIAGVRGLTSLLGLGLSFGVIFLVLLPMLVADVNPIVAALTACGLIIPITFFLSHGINKKTTTAMAGTLIALTITSILSLIFIEITKLWGTASEEAGFLLSLGPGGMDMRGLLMAGMVIGTLGVLDDITVSQAAIVEQLRLASPKLGNKDLYQRAMKVGRDHIASMINTLFLVYAGAALPLLLLFVDSSKSVGEVINYEMIAEEVVRTLVGSVGMMAAVPITTLLATMVFKKISNSQLINQAKNL